MKFLGRVILSSVAATLLAQPLWVRAADATNAAPDFLEVSKLLSAHLAGESEADLNREAVAGLVHQLHGRVSIVAGKSAPVEAATGAVLAKSAVYEGPTAYLRVGAVGAGLAKKIAAELKELGGTNQLKGVVLDLRFAGGADYAEAAEAADLFFAKERPLLDWGNGVVKSKAKSDAITLPLAVLVNAETAAAAEALAAVLREDDRAILLGANTAGEASMSEDFPLSNGQYLRIATAAIKLGDGETLSTKGVKPDIQVAVKPDEEKIYYADPYKEIPASLNLIASLVGDVNTNALSGTNRPPRVHPFNEAELMRERKASPGVDVSELTPTPMPKDTEPEPVIMRDPVLGRALDLVKGLALINRAQSP